MISSIGSYSSGGTTSSSYISQMQEKLFKALDTSGDGKIDKTELAAAKEKSSSGTSGGSSVDELISSLDTDDDAAISQLEFESGLSQLQQQMQQTRTEENSSSDREKEMFSNIDTNSDGTVSTDELAAFKAQGPEGGPSTEEMLTQLDTDGSGDVSESEFTTGMKNMKPPAGGPPASDTAGSTSSSDETTQVFSKMDTNQDGTVSAEELAAYKEANGIEGGPSTEEMLSQLDTDGSGDVSESEFTTGMKNMQANGPQGPPPGPPPEDASTTTASSTSTTSSTTTASTTAAEDSSYNLNQIFNIAMQSYMQALTLSTQTTGTTSGISSYA